MVDDRNVRISRPNQLTADEDRHDFSERIAQREIAKQLIETFVRRQAQTNQLQSFATLVALYADAGKSEPYDERERRAYRKLQEWLIAGRFYRNGVPCVWVLHEMEVQRCNVLGEELPGFQITDEILQQFRSNPNLDRPDHVAPWVPHMWAPTDLCAQFLKALGVEPPADWAPSPTKLIVSPQPTPKTSKRGRPPDSSAKYDWPAWKEDFFHLMDEMGDIEGGAPGWNTQADVVRAMRERIPNIETRPDYETMRAKIRGWLPKWRERRALTNPNQIHPNPH